MVPKGWQEVGAPTGVSAMVVNTGEEISDPALQRINFKSYYSVSYDKMGERTRDEYIAYIKNMVKQFAPGINFSSEEDFVKLIKHIYKKIVRASNIVDGRNEVDISLFSYYDCQCEGNYYIDCKINACIESGNAREHILKLRILMCDLGILFLEKIIQTNHS